jgi:uncharacterized protein YgiM (DUF1202 family)
MRAAFAWLLCLALLATASDGRAQDDDDVDVFARVVVSETSLRAGPGLGHRVIYRARRGETFIVKGREGSGFWLRVLLADGRLAYVLGDTIEPLTAEDDSPDAPSRPGFFAPPALQEARGGFAMLAGVFNHSGFAELKPALVLAPAIAIEPFVGVALSKVGRQYVSGGGGTLNFGPDWAIAPFVHIGAGGVTTTFNEDDPREDKTRLLARAGGGLLISLRWRILFRLEAMHNVIFETDFNTNVQNYSAGLGTYF